MSNEKTVQLDPPTWTRSIWTQICEAIPTHRAEGYEVHHIELDRDSCEAIDSEMRTAWEEGTAVVTAPSVKGSWLDTLDGKLIEMRVMGYPVVLGERLRIVFRPRA